MTSFRDKCQKLWPDSTAARLARSSGYGHRAAQKWLSGQAEVPPDVQSGVDIQFLRLSSYDPAESLQKATDEAVAKTAPEIVAARLAVIYKKLTGHEIN